MEIKFRAWDKARKVMIGIDYPDNWKCEMDECYWDIDNMKLTLITDASRDDNLIVMQYTGLKDKHWVEIAEGDILKDKYWVIEYEWYNYIVKLWIKIIDDNEQYGKNQVCWFYLERTVLEEVFIDCFDKNKGNKHIPIYKHIDRVEDTEIIWNIHENKELLKDTR